MNPFAEIARKAGLLRDLPFSEPEETVCRWCRRTYADHVDAHKDGDEIPNAYCMGLKGEFFAAGAKRPNLCTNPKCRRPKTTKYGICGDCEKKEATDHVEQLLAGARELIPKKFRGVTLDSQLLQVAPPEGRLTPAATSRIAVVSTARAAIDGRHAIVIVTGGTGSGKTSLATAMLSTVIERAVAPKATPIDIERARRVRYLNALSLSLARQEHRLGHGEPPSVHEAMDASILVIDEFGSDPRTTFDVPKVIHDREAAVKLTFVLTWLDQEGIGAAYSGGVARRLFDKAVHIELAKNVRPSGGSR